MVKLYLEKKIMALCAAFFFSLLLPLTSFAQDFSAEEVKEVQLRLEWNEYDTGGVDGKFGAKTATAIRAYQADWGIPETGVISEELISHLNNEHPDTRSRVQKAENQDCSVFNPNPQPAETITYVGPCVDGLAEGEGELTWHYVRYGQLTESTYEGGFRAGKYHGYGVSIKANGSRYEGGWKDYEYHGQGTRSYANGNRYEGEWKEGDRHGEGKYTWAEGGYYQGGFADGKLHGYGVRVYSDSDRYEGEWKEGDQHGQGTYTWADGDRYEGEWKEGEEHGQGTQTWASGSSYSGPWWNGKPHGRGTYITADGFRVVATWRRGCASSRNTNYAIATTLRACGF